MRTAEQKQAHAEYMRQWRVDYKEKNGAHPQAIRRSESASAYLSHLLAKARKRRDCFLTLEHLESLWESQGGACALSGVQMTYVVSPDGKPVWTNVTIDRIDSDLDYTHGNVQLACFAANRMRQDMPMETFREWCRLVVEGW